MPELVVKKALKYIPFYAKDYLTSEMHAKLDWARRGMYLECLLHAHLNDGIPADRTHLKNMLGAGVTDEDLEAILAPFAEHETKPGYLQHPKTAQVLAEQTKVIEKATAANKARWGKSKATAQAVTDAPQPGGPPASLSDEDKATLTRLLNALKAKHPNAVSISSAEATFWQKVAEGKITAANAQEVYTGLLRWCTSKQWTKDDGKYVLGLQKWIAEERWLDKPPQVKVPFGSRTFVTLPDATKP